MGSQHHTNDETDSDNNSWRDKQCTAGRCGGRAGVQGHHRWSAAGLMPVISFSQAPGSRRHLSAARRQCGGATGVHINGYGCEPVYGGKLAARAGPVKSD